MAAVSLGSSPALESAPSFAHLPIDIIAGIAGFLGHESLGNLGATSSSLRHFAVNDAGPLWKALCDKRWTNGRRKRFNGPPSKRPRNGVVVVDDGVNWREEFRRRFFLDRSVPGRLSRLVEGWEDKHLSGDDMSLAIVASALRLESEDGYPDGIVERAVAGFHVAAAERLLDGEDGADIFDKLVILSRDPEYSDAAKFALKLVNRLEAQHDWKMLLFAEEGAFAPVDCLMVITKFLLRSEDLVGGSSDTIYDDINRMLDALTAKDLGKFKALMAEGGGLLAEVGGIESNLLDKVLTKKEGHAMALLAIELSFFSSSVNGVEKWTNVEWCNTLRELVSLTCIAAGPNDDYFVPGCAAEAMLMFMEREI